MAVLIVLSALSMAWFFSANTVALDGLNGLPDNVQTIVNDSQLFIDNTVEDLEYVTKTNFDEFSDNINTDIDQISENVNKTIDSVIEQINFNKLVDISKFLTNLATDFNENKLPEWDGVLKKLTDQLVSIDDKATDFKNTVAESEYCSGNDLPICNTIADIPPLQISLISGLNLDDYKLTEDVLQAIKDVNKVLEDADEMINSFSSDFITDNIQSIKNTIEDLKKDINTQVDDIIKQVNNFNVEDAYENNFEEYLIEAQDYFDYVYYGVLGFGLFLVAILALYTIGILLGSFGSVGGPAKRQGK